MCRSHNSEVLGMGLLVERRAKNRRLNGRRGKTNFKKKVEKKQISVRKLSEPEERSKAKAGLSPAYGTTKGV